MASPELQRFLGQCTQAEQALVEEALHATFAEVITRDIQRNKLRSVFKNLANRLIKSMVYVTAKEKNTAIELIMGCREVWEQEYVKLKSEWVLELVVALGGSKQNLLDDERDRQQALNERACLRIEQILSSLVGFQDEHRKALDKGIEQYQFAWDAINASFADMMTESVMELADTLPRELLQRALSDILLPPL